MSNEPGERRRRRELERAQENSEPVAQLGRTDETEPAALPRSRRERRELERVAEFAASGTPAAGVAAARPSAQKPNADRAAVPSSTGPAPAMPGPAAPGSEVPGPAVRRPAQPANVPAPRVPAALSRRALRNAAGPGEPARTPVVRPPATTGTIRSVAPPAEPIALRPAGSPPTAGRGYPAVAPRRPSAFPAGPSAAAHQSRSAPDAGPSVPPPTPAALAPEASAAPASASATAPSSEAAWSPLTDIPAQNSRRDGADPGSADVVGAPLKPRWGTVPPGSFDAITQPGSADDEAGPDAALAPVAAADESARPRRSSYTWLQMIALALVAFVLGFLVWLLIKDPTDPGTASANALATTTSSSATSFHLGEP